MEPKASWKTLQIKVFNCDIEFAYQNFCIVVKVYIYDGDYIHLVLDFPYVIILRNTHDNSHIAHIGGEWR